MADKIKHLYNPELQTILESWQGTLYINKKFENIDEPFEPSFKKLLKWTFAKNPKRKEKKNDKWLPEVKLNDDFLKEEKDCIVWLGHASFYIKLQGKTFLTDPVFFDLPLIKRKVPAPCPADAFKNIDYLLLSHDHRDHCDKKILKIICGNNPEMQILTGLKMQKLLKGWLIKNPMQEAGWFQNYNLEEKNLRITYLPARHWSRRGLMDTNKRLWGSFMIEAGEKRIYFGADTGSGSHFTTINSIFPNISVCMLGIGAYLPPYMMQEIHMNPEEALEAYNQLGANTFIPMHFGTYDLSDEPISEPIKRLNEAWHATAQKGELVFPSVGKTIFI